MKLHSKGFFSVLSLAPITRKTAIKQAAKRDIRPGDYVGISWLGEGGKTDFVRFDDLTRSERKCLRL